jgi:hypothetical protein
MERTAELRWFFRGPAPAAVVAWFEAATDPPQARSDAYLVLAGTDALGVKIRGGTTRFELKLRPRPSTPLTLPGAVSGQLEEWQRWSFARSGISRFLPRLGLPKERWLEVGKRRRLTTLPYRGDAGCRVELTALQVLSQEWSTIGFEAFGPEPDLVPALKGTAEQSAPNSPAATPAGWRPSDGEAGCDTGPCAFGWRRSPSCSCSFSAAPVLRRPRR